MTSSLTTARFSVGVTAFSQSPLSWHQSPDAAGRQSVAGGRFPSPADEAAKPHTGAVLAKTPFGFVGVGIAIFLLPGVVGRGAAPKVAAEVFDRPLAFFAVLQEFNDLVFRERSDFHDWASLSSLGLGPSLSLYFISSSS
ncbi:hypothetical protein, partial [Deinococcus arenicola]